MSGIWRLAKASDLWMSDTVRTQRSYEGEEWQTQDFDGYSDGWEGVLEVWSVENITRNGWVTLVQERRPVVGTQLFSSKPRYGSLFEETGERFKIRTNDSRHFLLAVSDRLVNGELSIERERWERFGATPRGEEYRMPVLGVA